MVMRSFGRLRSKNQQLRCWPSLFSLHFASRPTFDSAKCKGMDEWSRRWYCYSATCLPSEETNPKPWQCCKLSHGNMSWHDIPRWSSGIWMPRPPVRQNSWSRCMDTSPAPPDLPWPRGKISVPHLLALPLHRRYVAENSIRSRLFFTFTFTFGSPGTRLPCFWDTWTRMVTPKSHQPAWVMP